MEVESATTEHSSNDETEDVAVLIFEAASRQPNVLINQGYTEAKLKSFVCGCIQHHQ
jgi:hypothetical protein